MNLAIVGTGYVGLVSGTCFAEMGTNVYCVDIDREKIEKLKRGVIPIYEPGLDRLVLRNVEKGRLHFTTSLQEALDCCELVFLAPGTPPLADGGSDLHFVWDIVQEIGRCMQGYKLIVIKSTVPVGTSARAAEILNRELDLRGLPHDYHLASNPEFLKEGDAIRDCLHPDRIVVGTNHEKARGLLEELYKPFTLNGHPILFMDIASAEMSKYACNAMLATRISFMNEMAGVCEEVGANIQLVRKAMGSDPRIGSKFLYAGTGYGGSCFPKDVKSIIHTGKEAGCPMDLMQAVEAVNQRQKTTLFRKLSAFYGGELRGKTVALWGLAFKPQTDDIREAPALALIDLLLEAGCRLRVTDPEALNNVRGLYGDKLFYAKDMYEAAQGTDAVLLVTEWKEFRMPDWARIKEGMRTPVVFDGRNIFTPAQLASQGIHYYGIGI